MMSIKNNLILLLLINLSLMCRSESSKVAIQLAEDIFGPLRQLIQPVWGTHGYPMNPTPLQHFQVPHASTTNRPEIEMEFHMIYMKLIKIISILDNERRSSSGIESNDLIGFAKKLHQLSQLSANNCLDFIDGDSYFSLRDFMFNSSKTRFNERKSNTIMNYVNQYYELQQQLCANLLDIHLSQRIAEIIDQFQEAEQFMDKLIEDVREQTRFGTPDYPEFLMARLYHNYYGSSILRTQKSQVDKQRRMFEMKEKCANYIVKPLSILMQTMEVSENIDIKRKVDREHKSWTRSYKICESISLLNNNNNPEIDRRVKIRLDNE